MELEVRGLQLASSIAVAGGIYPFLHLYATTLLRCYVATLRLTYGGLG